MIKIDLSKGASRTLRFVPCLRAGVSHQPIAPEGYRVDSPLHWLLDDRVERTDPSLDHGADGAPRVRLRRLHRHLPWNSKATAPVLKGLEPRTENLQPGLLELLAYRDEDAFERRLPAARFCEPAQRGCVETS